MFTCARRTGFAARNTDLPKRTHRGSERFIGCDKNQMQTHHFPWILWRTWPLRFCIVSLCCSQGCNANLCQDVSCSLRTPCGHDSNFHDLWSGPIAEENHCQLYYLIAWKTPHGNPEPKPAIGLDLHWRCNPGARGDHDDARTRRKINWYRLRQTGEHSKHCSTTANSNREFCLCKICQ